MTIAFRQMMYERNEDVYLSYVSLHPEDTYYVELPPTYTALDVTQSRATCTHRERPAFSASHAINSSQPQRIRHTQ